MQLPRLWAGRSALAWCLWPVSIVYGVLFWLRKQLYALGIFKSVRVAASVIVVGNVVAGGAGKTPLTLALVQHLKAQNVHVGIVSRGYGRASMQLQSVTPNSTPADVGDEPLFIFQQCQVPVVVGSYRTATRHGNMRHGRARHWQRLVAASRPAARAVAACGGLAAAHRTSQHGTRLCSAPQLESLRFEK